jgi:hypothetical protein
MTAMSALLPDRETLSKFAKRLRLSSDERATGMFIIQHREQFEQLQNKSDNDILQQYKELLLDKCTVVNNFNDIFSFSVVFHRCANYGVKLVCELAAYCGHFACVDELHKWQMPKIPVDGSVLASRGVTYDKRFSAILQVLVLK